VPELGQRVVQSHGISDPGMPALAAVFDPVTLRKHFHQALPDDWGAIQNIRFQILKHHPGKRCTFEIALETANGWRYLIGKVYSTDRSDVYRVMNELRRAGFGPEDELSIPQPVAYVPVLRLLLQEKVRGPRAKEVFLTGDESDRAVAAVRSARWLAKFHSVAPRSWHTTDLTDHVNSADRWSQTIAKLGEPFAGRAKRLAKRLQEEEAAFANGGELCAGHGSYNCNQIILTEGRTITLDWDSYDVADPCRDVARFIVNLQRLALKYLGSFQALDAAAEAFLKTYTALSPFDVSANLALYRALMCLKLAKYEANRPVCNFPEAIEALLHEGLRVLEQEAGKHHGKIG